MFRHMVMITGVIFFLSSGLAVSQSIPGFGGFLVTAAKYDQDIKFKDVVPGTFYGLTTNYSTLPLGFDVGPGMLGIFAKCGFGIGYSFNNKGDIGDKIQMNLMIGLGPAAYMPVGNMAAVGLKFFYLYDLDRISSRGFVLQPSVLFGPVLLEAGFLSPMSGEDKDMDHKMLNLSLMFINGRVGYGIKYDKRSALTAVHGTERSNYEQIHLVLEVR